MMKAREFDVRHQLDSEASWKKRSNNPSGAKEGRQESKQMRSKQMY